MLMFTFSVVNLFLLVLFKKINLAFGRNQLIVWSASAARPNLELENPTFLGRKIEVSATADMWLQGWIDFFMQPFVTVHSPAN